MKMRKYIEALYEDEPETAMMDTVAHGCVNGCCPGLIYYHETTEFYDRFEGEIWNLLEQQAKELSYKSVLEFIADFNGADSVRDITRFKNLLCWYAVEETCKQVLEEKGVANEADNH